MGYSKSILTLRRRLPMVEAMTEGRDCVWECDPKDEKRIAYAIREALWIAQNIGAEEFPELAAAAPKFSIKETGAGKVIAQAKSNHYPTPVALRAETAYADSLEEIIQTIQRTKVFPLRLSVELSREDLIKLHEWLQRNTTHLMFWADDSITIRPHTKEMEDLAFVPSDLDDQT